MNKRKHNPSPQDADLLSRSNPKEFGQGYDFQTGHVHPSLVDINHLGYKEGLTKFRAWHAGEAFAKECMQREAKLKASERSINTVGELKEALDKIPDDMPLAAYDPYDHLLDVEEIKIVIRRMDIHTPTLVIITK